MLISVCQLRSDASKTLDTLNEESIRGDPFSTTFLMEQRDLPARFGHPLAVGSGSAFPPSNSHIPRAVSISQALGLRALSA